MRALEEWDSIEVLNKRPKWRQEDQIHIIRTDVTSGNAQTGQVLQPWQVEEYLRVRYDEDLQVDNRAVDCSVNCRSDGMYSL